MTAMGHVFVSALLVVTLHVSIAVTGLDRQLLELCGDREPKTDAVKAKLLEGAKATAASDMGESAE